jgi:hypothetical protein
MKVPTQPELIHLQLQAMLRDHNIPDTEVKYLGDRDAISHPSTEWTIRKLSQGVDRPVNPCYSYLISQAKATTDNPKQTATFLFYYGIHQTAFC